MEIFMNKWESRLALIILNYNGADLTLSNVHHIRTLSASVNIIVVDNCSTDDSRDKLSALNAMENVHYIENTENTGYASGNNVGIRYAIDKLPEVDTVCVLNPDIVVDSAEDFDSLYEALWTEDRLAGLTALTIYNGIVRMPNDFGWKRLSRKHMMFGGTMLSKLMKVNSRYGALELNDANVAYSDIIQGCFFLLKKDVAAEIGLLDEHTFLYQEEAILGKKLADAGYREGVLTTVYIRHNHKEKEKSLIKRANKLFDMKCFYNSRKYYIREYSGESKLFIKTACAFLSLDHAIKRLTVRIKYRK